jgi:WD40 repeat protein
LLTKNVDTGNELPTNCLTFNQGCEVEDLEILPDGNLFVSVGGNFTKLWDVRRNEKPVYEITANTKTVSCVKILESGKRVLTGSYDGFLKIFDPQDELKIVHQKKMPAPIMGLAISHNMESMTVGYATGQVDILYRNLDHIEGTTDFKNEADWDAFEKNLYKTLTVGVATQKDVRSRRFFLRGVYATPGEFDTKVDQKNSKRLQKFDRLLRYTFLG